MHVRKFKPYMRFMYDHVLAFEICFNTCLFSFKSKSQVMNKVYGFMLVYNFYTHDFMKVCMF